MKAHRGCTKALQPTQCCTVPRQLPALHHQLAAPACSCSGALCFLATPRSLPCLPITAAPLFAIFSNWHKVPLNTWGKQSTQECWSLFTPNFGTLHFRDTNRYLVAKKYFPRFFRLWTLLGKLCWPEMLLLYFQTFLTAF